MPKGIPNKREDMRRVPAGMPRKKLVAHGLESSKKYFWADKSQFAELQAAGYKFVMNQDDIQTGDVPKDHPGSRVTVPASRTNDEKLFLMEIPKDWYDENQKLKQAQINEQENEMFNRGDTKTSYTVKGTRKETGMV